MTRTAPSESELALRQAHGEALTRLVLESPAHIVAIALGNPALEDAQLLLLLRRPDIGPELLETVATEMPWAAKYLVKAAVVGHPHTPRTIALNLVKHLFWRDLSKILVNFQLSPAVRRMAEVTLADRITEITLGERISLARSAPREVVRALRGERDPRIVGSLLDNPRLTEADVSIMIHDRNAPPEVLATLGRAERWMNRGSLRLALVCRPQTPLATAFALLAAAAEPVLRKVADNPGASSGVRATARRILREKNNARSLP